MEQCIYRDKSTSRTVRKTWTLNELQSCVIADESINQYYKKNWKNCNFHSTDQNDLPNEQWRPVNYYRHPNYQVYASNLGRIKRNGKILQLYEYHHGNLTPSNLDSKTRIGYLKATGLGLYVYQMVADAWFPDYTYGASTDQEIHHITNDGYDNRPQNLIILSKSAHSQINNAISTPDKDYHPGKYDKI